ncbi:MAG: S1/P1 nuclease [Candidatus Nitronauta litoralis]|uniref:S1/P1 nuclease n=1 Tax=Candidatus Nitronauta litoralis TaxID=2705533 RepID=A0A7T0BZ70_9BACT|nr:MAG: S1/P1 nuclease [Candidatus Nitronauta litoralis]
MPFEKIRHTRIVRFLYIAGCFVVLLASAFPAQVWAWGPQGHRIIAQIAEERLKPEIWQAIQDEFSIKHLADVANWADQIKSDRRETRPWHYCNIAEGELLYLQQRDCPHGECVIEKTHFFREELLNPSVVGRKRKEAFMFLVHFVGDIHQPLHMGNAADRGGNTIKVMVSGERTNLHAVWDHDLIHTQGQSLVKYAAKLSASIQKENALEWGARRLVEWANESRKLAVHQGYPLELNDQGELSRHYLKAGEQAVELQLKKAGVRLADLLNKTLKP